jgi:hypothetical protein
MRIRKLPTMVAKKIIRVTLFALLGVALLITSLPAFSQSCALCYTQAASSGARMVRALQAGILILVLPPTLGTLGVIAVCYRKRNKFHDPDTGDSNYL